MEVETRLRKFISEILNPFNERVGTINKELKQVRLDTTSNTNSIIGINMIM